MLALAAPAPRAAAQTGGGWTDPINWVWTLPELADDIAKDLEKARERGDRLEILSLEVSLDLARGWFQQMSYSPKPLSADPKLAPEDAPGQAAGIPVFQPRIEAVGSEARTIQPTEPTSLWRRLAPPPGRPGEAPTLQLRALNAAGSAVSAGGGFQPAARTVDFLRADDLSYLARVDIDQGLGTAFYEPQDMASSADGTRLAVVSRGSDRRDFPTNPVPNHLTVLDAVAGRLDKRIHLGDAFWPTSVALSPDGSTAYVAVSVFEDSRLTGEQFVLFLELASGRSLEQVALPSGGRTGEMRLTPDGALLFVLGGIGSATKLHVVDTRSATLTATIAGLPGQAESRAALREATEIAMHPRGTKVYVSDARAPQSETDFETVGVAVVDVATATVELVAAAPGARRLGSGDDLAVFQSGDFVAHLDGVSGLLTVFDAATLEVVGQSDLGDALFEVALARAN
ncbi:MAG: hypothetical protein GC160_26360 [Acidobacteria bacterium]|nr:hypothetical protein [Acidobacteriota bacterium]